MIELQSVWGWQPALYLFLGGMGAGAFVVAAVLYLRCGSKAGKTVAVSAWCSIVCLAVGLLCLLPELTNPLRGLLLWQSFSNFSSWMTIGAWVLVAALVVFGVFAVLSTEKTAALVSQAWKGLYAKRHRVLSVLAIVGIVLGIGVAAYTGILLMSAPGVPLWNTPLLPFLFTVSGLDTGIALVEVVSVANAKKEALPSRGHRLMEKLVVVLVVVEAIVLAVLLTSMHAGGPQVDGGASGSATAALSADLLTTGSLAPWFWALVVACGLAMPLLAALTGLISHRGKRPAKAVGQAGERSDRGLEAPDGPRGQGFADSCDSVKVSSSDAAPRDLESKPAEGKGGGMVLAGAFGALVGGCALRFVVVLAGVHADPVADATAQLFANMLGRLS